MPPDPVPNPSNATTDYQRWLDELESQRRHYLEGEKKWNLLRTALFLAAALLLLVGYFMAPSRPLAALGWVFLVAFLVAVTWHENIRDRMQAKRSRGSVLKRLLARTQRRWDRLPLWNPKSGPAEATTSADSPNRTGPSAHSITTTPRTDATHAQTAHANATSGVDTAAVADDLDVFGQGSLFQLVSMASLGPGLRTLADWLIGPATQAAATRRHDAAQTLAPMRDWRVDFYTQARRVSTGTSDPDRFLKWIRSSSWLDRHPMLALWSRLSAFLMLGLLVALAASLLARMGADAQTKTFLANALTLVAGGIAAIVAINMLISTFLLGDVHEIFASALSGRGDVDGYRQMFALCESIPKRDDAKGRHSLLAQVRETLCDGETSASSAMAKLSRVAAAAGLKSNAGLFLVYLALQMGGLWDLHILRRLEFWQRQHEGDAAKWFQALGELEAAASLAALIDENPDWASPTWLDPDAAKEIIANQIGHPLLPDGKRVCNDVTVGPQGTLLLVTGSNMSGKSTLLRSIGLNTLLAGAGGPVCAKSLALPDLELATSIRVRDNLAEGVSFYMAELKSLARVVRHAEAIRQNRDSANLGSADTRSANPGSATRVETPDKDPRPNSTTLLYLLDEILQGTNSRERQIAVAHVLRHLIDNGAIGAISTHDLELADDPVLKSLSHTVHFRETITKDSTDRDVMTFDYRMREGVSPTTNALRLLEVVGLGTPSPNQSTGHEPS